MVYVDALMQWGWRYGKSCHLIADSLEELHLFAESIGMKRQWFQEKSHPHYDLTEKRRIKALKLGAIELERKEFVKKLRECRKEREN